MREIRNKPIVGVDLDDTIYKFVEPLLKKYNIVYHDNIKFEDITNYHIHNFLRPECKNIFKDFANKAFFEDIVIDDDVKKELKKINEKYQLYFVTAGAPITIRDRDKILSRNLDWYSSSQLIACKDKHLLKLDYLIDDCQHNLEGLNDYVGILIDKPWNRMCDRFIRSQSFISIADIIERIDSKKSEEPCLSGEWWDD